MPIIITEVDVSVRVTDAESPGSNNDNSAMREEIIKECIEQIMTIINNKSER